MHLSEISEFYTVINQMTISALAVTNYT